VAADPSSGLLRASPEGVSVLNRTVTFTPPPWWDEFLDFICSLRPSKPPTPPGGKSWQLGVSVFPYSATGTAGRYPRITGGTSCAGVLQRTDQFQVKPLNGWTTVQQIDSVFLTAAQPRRDLMDPELMKIATSLGVGGILAAAMLCVYRKDALAVQARLETMAPNVIHMADQLFTVGQHVQQTLARAAMIRPHRHLSLLFILALVCASTVEAATSYVVAQTGSDSNPGTDAAPFQTVVHGVSKLTPGDTLFVRAGTYNEALLRTAVPFGTSWSNKVRIAAYLNESVSLRPTSDMTRTTSHFATCPQSSRWRRRVGR
jgi:hypothetical protein